MEICLPSEVVMSERKKNCRNSWTALILLSVISLKELDACFVIAESRSRRSGSSIEVLMVVPSRELR